MAYGVKYRLEFEDVLGNDKKIEILKNNYTGSVLPLVCTSNPVVIKWESDNEFYKPIIGSTCTINLFVTDSVQYDNFYAFDENEYQVKIFYKDTSNNYQIYWIGFIVADTFKQAVTTTPYQIQLKAFDGLGLLDGKNVTIKSGDLVRGDYSENDGSDLAPEPTNTLARNIADCLTQTNLSLSIFTFLGDADFLDTINGSRVLKFDENFNPLDCKTYLESILFNLNCRIFQSYGRWYILDNSLYQDNYNITNYLSIGSNRRAAATKYLQENKTETVTYRVYRSDGSLFGNGSDGGETILNSAINKDVLINFQSDVEQLNNDLIVEYLPPAKTFKHELDQVQAEKYNKELIQDPSFEVPKDDIGTAGSNVWDVNADVPSYSGAIGEYEYVSSGSKSLRSNETINSGGINQIIFNQNNHFCASSITSDSIVTRPIMSTLEDITFTFKVYVDGSLSTTAFGGLDFKWILHGQQSTNDNEDKTWDDANSQWSNQTIFNTFEVTEFNKWVTKSVTFQPFNKRNIYRTTWYAPVTNSGVTLNYYYFDDISILRSIDNNKTISRTLTTNTNVKKLSYRNMRLFSYLSYKGQGDILELNLQNQLNDFRTHVPRYEGTLYKLGTQPMSMKNKIWVNYAPVFLKGISDVGGGQESNRLYTSSSISGVSVGDFVTGVAAGSQISTTLKVTQKVAATGSKSAYIVLDNDIQYAINDIVAITKYNALISPVSSLYSSHEPVACIVDGMEYNVKQNTYKVKMHVPNQDDDISNTLQIKTK